MATSSPNVGGAAGATGSAKNSMTPGFLGGAGGGEKPVGLNARNEKGASILGAAENAAAGADISQNNDDLDGARDGEENVDSVNYTGSGREEVEEKQKQGFFSNHKGPVAGIIGLVMLLGLFFGGSQLIQPFGFVDQLRTSFNSMQTSVATRSNVLFKYQLGKDVKNPVKSKFFSNDVFKISEKQRTKLARNGIEIEEIDGENVMKYTGADGKTKYVVADANSKLKSRLDAMDFDTAFKTDNDFFNAYKGGSLTWRGSVTNWFESLTTKFLSDNRLTRNLFQNFRSKVNENGGDAKATAIDLISKGTDEVALRTDDVRGMSEGKDGKMNVETESSSEQFSFKGKSSAEVETKLGDTLRANVKGDSGGGISGAVQTGSSIICGIADLIGVGSLVVAGAEALQVIHLVTSYLEAIDKVKAGNGDDSPINEIANSLNQRKTNYHYEYTIDNPASLSGMDGSTDSQWKQLETNAKKIGMSESYTTKSASESSGFVSLFGGGKVNPYDESVRSFNFTGNIKRIVGGLGVSMASFTSCAAVKFGANLAGVFEGVAEWGPCIIGILGSFFTFGASAAACTGAAANIILKVVTMTTIAAAIYAVTTVLVPVMAKLLTRDLITDLAGEDLGNALVSGANMYMGNNHRYNGGSLGGKEEYIQFAMAQQEVIAEDARYERMNKNPFDASSQYTFLGTILRQAMNYVGKGSVMSVITSTNNVLSSSIASIMPTASAIDASNNLIDNYDEICPYLASIGAVGDAFCNPYAITDISTLGVDPSEVIEQIKGDLIIENTDGSNDGCDKNTDDYSDCVSKDLSASGGIRIKGNSQLAKYIRYCNQRSSSFGIMDTNISNDVAKFSDVRTNLSGVDAVANGTIGAIPIYGDLVDVVQNGQKLANIGYVKGTSCVAGNDLKEGETFDATGNYLNDDKEDYISGNEGVEGYDDNGVTGIATPSWDKAKYYQRFIEDQSLMESMGIIEKSAVTAYIEEYQEDYPLDNSYEGVLARYSGVSKEDVVAFLEDLEYYTYLANYNPSERYAFGQEIRPAGAGELKFDNDQKVAYVILLNTIEFADVRNRSFVV